jgi:UDP-GlcNAc:undecaprenyl-phosphate GlcNAc-1-phosphate transferase
VPVALRCRGDTPLTAYVTPNVLGAFFVGCLAVTAVITPGLMRMARAVGAVDRGGYRKVYRGEMPLLGGVGIALPLIGLSLAAGIAGHVIIRNWQWVWLNHRESFDLLLSLASIRYECITLAVGGIGIVLLGLFDDIRGMRARWKLLGQIVVALFVLLSGNVLTTVSLPIAGAVDLGIVLGSLLTVLWVVGLINAFNLIDGIDGLATGIALIGAGALVALSFLQETAFVTLAGAALAGSLLAFLLFNFPPARIFLGDTGSMFLGYSLAVMSLSGSQKSETAVIIFAPMLALSLPLFETLVSIVRRYIRGVPIFAGDNQHTHHRLLRKGYSQPWVVLILYATGLALAAAAVLSAVIPEGSRWAWSPYALYLATLVNVAWLAGYLRPTALKTVLARRHRNRVFQALGRYASLCLHAGAQSGKVRTLLDLCRQELGLRHIDIRLASGETLAASPGDRERSDAAAHREELRVKSAEGQDVLIVYEFEHSPEEMLRQDVAACLAGIFDQISIDAVAASMEAGAAPPAESGSPRIVSFTAGGQRRLPG